jgi:hypothetical protein
MIVQIDVERRVIPVRLDWRHWRWHSLVEQQESDLPQMTVVEGKRYELYSDGSFAEVAR